jgi:hypothetical protein
MSEADSDMVRVTEHENRIMNRAQPIRPQHKLVNFGIKKSFLSFYIYLRDAARFYPWEVSGLAFFLLAAWTGGYGSTCVMLVFLVGCQLI